MLTIVWKDFRTEVRTREIAYTTICFAVTCILVFAFALVREGRALPDVAAGILWIAIAFSGTVALGRAFEREREADTLRALLMTPASRGALYVGKLAGMIILMGASELLIVPITAILFQAPLFERVGLLVALLGLGTIGFAAVGTLFAAMLARARSRDVLLPLVLFPIVIPVVIAGVRGTAALLEVPPDLTHAHFWIGLLAAFDALFLTLALWTFEPVMAE